MTAPHSSSAVLPAPAFETQLDMQDHCSAVNDDAASPVLSYRASPDGSVTMGTDPLSGQVVLIVQNSATSWEIALPPKIARYAPAETGCSLAAAQQVAEQAFSAYWAASQK